MTDEKEKKVSFIPFHALNHFMRDGYRRDVIRTAVNGMRGLPKDLQRDIEKQIKRFVKVPGFRNSARAPLSLTAKHMPDAFEKSPDVVKAILAAWAELNAGLRQQVFDLLETRGWEMLPVDADRTKLPGFLTTWPEEEDFEVINQAFTEKYPDAGVESDDVSLMTVWLSGRLPVEANQKEETST